jgi:hypothetical protein
MGGKREISMSRICFQRNDLEQGHRAITRAYWSTTQRLQPHYSLTVNQHWLIKWLVER